MRWALCLWDPTSGGHTCILVGHSRALSLPETLVGVGGITLPDRQTFSSLRQTLSPLHHWYCTVSGYLGTCGGLVVLPGLASCLLLGADQQGNTKFVLCDGSEGQSPWKTRAVGSQYLPGGPPHPAAPPNVCLLCWSPAAPKGLRCVWLPPCFNHRHLVTSSPLCSKEVTGVPRTGRAEGRKCYPALHRASACPVRGLHMVVPGSLPACLPACLPQ